MLQSKIDQWLDERINAPCQRQLVVIHAEQDWARQQALAILDKLNLTRSLWCGNSADNQPYIQAKQYHQHLGREYQALVYNAYDGLRANALAALSGVVAQQGLMIIICPPLGKWADFNDPQKPERISFGYTTEARHSLFVKWLKQHIEQDNDVVLISQEHFRGHNVPLHKQLQQVTSPYKTLDQQHAVEAILTLVDQSNPAPLVITADRGRGKSSALGIAAAQLLNNGHQRILVTAPIFASVSQLFQHAEEGLPGSEQQRQALILGHQRIEFQPVDRILAEQPQADILMIDEAASIPAPLLQALTRHYSKIVFSTTIHGYEGSGRGFEIRFKGYLQHHFPAYQRLHLQQPIRWQTGDPLEKFWFDTLLLKSVDSQTSYQAGQDLQVELIDQPSLASNPKLLTQIFCLLINAHYQTTPDDLVRMLDAPDQQVFVLRQQNHLLGAALANLEGTEILRPLAVAISEGKRRVKGHLLPQNLAMNFGRHDLVCYQYLRIIRIAIAPEFQFQGLGQYFIRQLTQHARKKRYDFIGSSFGASPQLLAFWSKAGFHLVRQGQKKDASSGEFSAFMLAGLHQGAVKLRQALTDIYQQQQGEQP
ncbi:tRNA(Met) cytidine acetyltransferase TmcA [Neptunicella sp. SCSIO 80796]|uniref:tRNA(Met) cytidine acetyltransferase TmcA n=1 Tax=Neptunicella plasticusilytica TaxID=3117012 RepID=UPI003A4DD279